MRRPIALYPTLFAAAFVFRVWTDAAVDVMAAARPLIVAILIALLVTVVATAILRDRVRGGVLALLVVGVLIVGKDPRILVLAGVVAVLMVIEARSARSRRSTIPWPRIDEALHVFGVVLLVVSIVPGVLAWWSAPTPSPAAGEAMTGTAVASGPPPDIYVVLLDAHGRADTLANAYDYDAGPFERGLESLGIDVTTNNRSNYMTTRLTLSSMLNFRWVQELGLGETATKPFDLAMTRAIGESRTFEILRQAGYSTFAMPSGFDHVALHPDQTVGSPWLGELERIILGKTMLGSALDAVAPTFIDDQDRARILEQFDLLPTLAASPDDPPRFAFAHVPAPHWPYLFNADGSTTSSGGAVTVVDEPTERSPEVRAAEADRYAEQIAYIDRLAGDAISGLAARLVRPSVVVVMSDHGPDAHIDWYDLVGVDPTERFTNLFAVAEPNGSAPWPADTSPIDILATVFDRYLGTTLPTNGPHTFLGSATEINGVVSELTEIPNPDAIGP